MTKNDFIKRYNYYQTKTAFIAFTTEIANETYGLKKKVEEIVSQLTNYYKEVNPDTKDHKRFEKYLTQRIYDLRKEAKRVREEGLKPLIDSIIEAEERTPTITLKEGEYLADKLNDYLQDTAMDLTKERVLLVAPTGTGKSTATGGLLLSGRQGVVILKDTKALVENAYNDLKMEMKNGTIPKRKLYMFSGDAKIDTYTLKQILTTPESVIVATYNKLSEIRDALESTRTKIEVAKKEGIIKNTLITPTKLVDWIFVLDESHKLITDASFRPEVLMEVQATLEKNRGYITTTATPKTYCPLTYDRVINVKKEIVDINSEVLLYTNPKTELEAVFEGVIESLDKKKTTKIFWFENDSKTLELKANKLREKGFQAAEMGREVFNADKEDTTSLAYSITQGKLNAEIVLTTKLLLEGISITEACDEVHYFLKLSGENVHSLEIIQAAARVRKAGKIFIHILRPETPLSDTEVIDLKKFSIHRIDVEIDEDKRNANTTLLNIINMYFNKVAGGEMPIKEVEPIIESLKKAVFTSKGYLFQHRNQVEGRTDREIIYSNIMESFLNYKRDIRLEATALGRPLFLKRLERAGHKNVTYITEVIRRNDEEIKAFEKEKEISETADRCKVVEEFEQQNHELIIGYLKGVGGDDKEPKLKRFLAWYVIYMYGLNKPLKEILDHIRVTKKSRLQTEMEKWKAGLYYIITLIKGRTSVVDKALLTRLGDNGRAESFLQRLQPIQEFLEAKGETLFERDIDNGFKVVIEAKEWEEAFPKIKLGNILTEMFEVEIKQYGAAEKRGERYYEITNYSQIIQTVNVLKPEERDRLVGIMKDSENYLSKL